MARPVLPRTRTPIRQRSTSTSSPKAPNHSTKARCSSTSRLSLACCLTAEIDDWLCPPPGAGDTRFGVDVDANSNASLLLLLLLLLRPRPLPRAAFRPPFDAQWPLPSLRLCLPLPSAAARVRALAAAAAALGEDEARPPPTCTAVGLVMPIDARLSV